MVDVLRKRQTIGVISMILSRERRPTPRVPGIPPTDDAVFPSGALISMFIAPLFDLILQRGTTGAATIMIVFTSAWCRGLGYIIYGTNVLVIMFLTIISTILARISELRRGGSSTVKDFASCFAGSASRPRGQVSPIVYLPIYQSPG